ncbi:hypothetical protein V1264_009438 [Littorina saxatilis]|uniref:G-protein coupled receptors family 1 profile domain-containing protein n=2 Tax=Littorina saxatilis TaxID=31220 RepID=A0AAN9G1X5_9CAEN
MYNRTVLWQLNNEMSMTLLPAVIYLVILMLVGAVGNFLVVYIFGWKLKGSTQNCLFMWLGVFDIISCVIGMPSEIVDISHYYLYENAVACKVMRFLLTVPPIASANLLVVIAIDRYRRVCKPLHVQMEVFHARIGVGVSALVAVVVAGPAISIYGNRTVKTPVPGLDGCDCSVQDKYQGRLYPLLYEIVFGASFVVYTVVLSVLYCRVGMEIRRHKRYMARHSITYSGIALSTLIATSEVDDSSVTESPDNARKESRGLQSEAALVKNDSAPAAMADVSESTPNTAPGGRNQQSESLTKNNSSAGKMSRSLQSEPLLSKKNGTTASSADSGDTRKTPRSKQSEMSVKIRKSLRASKLAVLAVAVTVVFVVSYLPHLCLIITRTVVEDLRDHKVSTATLVSYNIFLRSFFINSVANVFVYSVMNTEFKLQCRQLCACVKRQRRVPVLV